MGFWEVSLILCLILDLNKMKHQISSWFSKEERDVVRKEWPLNCFLLFLLVLIFHVIFLFLISSAMKMDGCLLFILATKLNFVVAKKLPSWECFRIFLLTWVLLFSFHKPKQNQGSPTQPFSAGCTVPMSTEASSFFCSFCCSLLVNVSLLCKFHKWCMEASKGPWNRTRHCCICLT